MVTARLIKSFEDKDSASVWLLYSVELSFLVTNILSDHPHFTIFRQ